MSNAYDWKTYDDILKIKIEYDADNERCLIKIPNSDKEINFNCGDYYEMCDCLEEFIQAYIEIRD